MTLYIILGAFGAALIWGIFIYNRFVALVQRVKEAWADIDVQLKRRYDLIPNLIETVKGYAGHEKETLAKVTDMRTRAMSAQTPKEHAAAENMLTGALEKPLCGLENYPDLKANQNFLELQRELSDTENKIQAARRFYNGNVRDLGTLLGTFPSNIIGNMFKFKEAEFFELAEGEAAAREPVKVQF